MQDSNHEGQRPRESEVFLQDVPNHERPPSRAARANVVKIDLNAIGFVSMSLTLKEKESRLSLRPRSEKCESTKLSTFPETLKSSQCSGKEAGGCASRSMVTRTSRNLVVRSVIDSS